MGWTLNKWQSLDADEQEFWLAHETDRIEKINGLREWLTHTKEGDKPSIDGTAYTIIRMLGDLL